MTTARSRSAAMARKPPETSATKLSFSGSSSGSALVGRSGSSRWGTWMPRTSSIDHAKVSALRKKTTSTLVAAISRAPSIGPTKKERLSMVLPVPFEAVSSSGVEARAGIRARWAQRNGVPSSPAQGGQDEDRRGGGVEDEAQSRPRSRGATAAGRPRP